MDELEAIRLLKNGQVEYLDVLVRKYQLKAIRAAYLITQDRGLAEDVVQETFIKMYKRIHQFDESRPFLPYFLRSVINAALNTVRGNSRVVPLEQDIVVTEDLLEKARVVESQVEYRQLIEEIQASIAKLNPRQRAVIVQRYYLEMSENEMVLEMDVPPGTIKWLLHSARKQLARVMTSERSSQ
jgi:RNA polymerase sigma-70 factor, ECF subfamily